LAHGAVDQQRQPEPDLQRLLVPGFRHRELLRRAAAANTGEIAGVFLHEWGHSFDQNDGGGTDNPGEAYGDITR
jgi:hypothetical protein